jgi:hypothetical protein
MKEETVKKETRKRQVKQDKGTCMPRVLSVVVYILMDILKNSFILFGILEYFIC